MITQCTHSTHRKQSTCATGKTDCSAMQTHKSRVAEEQRIPSRYYSALHCHPFSLRNFIIMKTCPWNVYPLIPHLYRVILVLTGVNLFSLVLIKRESVDHYWESRGIVYIQTGK